MKVNQDGHSGGQVRIRTCSPIQTPAHGSATCGMFWIAKSIMALAKRTNWTTSPTPCVIFDSVDIFTWPSSTSFLMCSCRWFGSFHAVETSTAGSQVLPPRTLSRIPMYDPTSFAVSLSSARLLYAASQSLWDVEGAGVGCSVDSIAFGSARGSTDGEGGGACDVAAGW